LILVNLHGYFLNYWEKRNPTFNIKKQIVKRLFLINFKNRGLLGEGEN